ncbi:MAG TPA: hypothetical protein VF486_19335 [Actinomycetes bacterium]
MARRLGIALLVVLAVAALAAPARAVGAFGPAVTVVDLGCAGTDFSGAVAALGGDGLVRGWAVSSGPSCSDDRIWFFQGAGGSWTRQRSPYRGRLLAAAFDGTGAYVMYQAGDGIHLSKRTAGGTFTAGRLLSTASQLATGSVIATGGSWWAVWSEQTGENRFGDPVLSLFQAKTYGTDQARQRITSHGGDSDSDADLALRPGGGAVLVWSRLIDLDESSEIRVATSADGRWTSRTFSAAADFSSNLYPEVTTDGRWTYVTWELDRHINESDNRSGSFRGHRFFTPGDVPRIAVSGGKTFVVWTAQSGSNPPHVFVAERAGSTWTGLNMPRATTGWETALEVTAYRGKATVLQFDANVGGRDLVLARTQL